VNAPFKLCMDPSQVAYITECEGVFVVEPMRFLTLCQAKALQRPKPKRRERTPEEQARTEILRSLGR
jgi:hypothetical protein